MFLQSGEKVYILHWKNTSAPKCCGSKLRKSLLIPDSTDISQIYAEKCCYSEEFVYALRQKVAVTDRPATNRRDVIFSATDRPVTNCRDVIFSATEGKQHQQVGQAPAGVSASFVEFLLSRD